MKTQNATVAAMSDMGGMGWMMGGMTLFWILTLILVVLGVIALVKYIASR